VSILLKLDAIKHFSKFGVHILKNFQHTK